MNLYTLVIVTFVIFMAVNVIIGLRGRSHAQTTSDFLTASGQSGFWFIVSSAVGASIGAGVVIGTAQYAVSLGVAGAWYAIACCHRPWRKHSHARVSPQPGQEIPSNRAKGQPYQHSSPKSASSARCTPSSFAVRSI